MAIDDFVHRFEPATTAGARTLLLLHGTGGDESDLLPLGRLLDPGAALLSPRGQVLEHGMPRYFRRIAEGVFDQEDLAQRTDDLALWIAQAATHYPIDLARTVAVGFSNGANIAAALLLRRPGLLSQAILFRAMVPFVPDPLPVLAGTRVFLSAGRLDTMIPASNTEKLAKLLRSAGAEVELQWEDAGHQLTRGAVEAAKAWLERQG
jgi:phospholipase/carboxylesterase